jgi:hypothetical protein
MLSIGIVVEFDRNLWPYCYKMFMAQGAGKIRQARKIL